MIFTCVSKLQYEYLVLVYVCDLLVVSCLELEMTMTISKNDFLLL